MTRLDSTPTAAESSLEIRAIADTCVKCGLCIERCPSYRVLQREQDSPRGRIAIAAAIADGTLAASDAHARAALDRCLNCGTCTRVCPAGVDYNRLIDLVRAEVPVQASIALHAARFGTRHRALLKPARAMARAVARSSRSHEGVDATAVAQDPASLPAAGAMMLRALAAMPSDASARPAPFFVPAVGPRRGSVALFRGCVAGVLDGDTQSAAMRVLSRIGFDVHAPLRDHCCGALDRHEGREKSGKTRAREAFALYAATAATTVLGTVSGCHAQLQERVFADSPLAFDDLFAFLDRDERLAALELATVPGRVALHVPCTQRDIAGADAAVRRVLARIPALQLVVLPAEPICCGAAGTYFMRFPQIANALRDETVDQAQRVGAALLATTNVGCRMHLSAGFMASTSTPLRAREGLAPAECVQVVHPIVLLDQALRQSPA